MGWVHSGRGISLCILSILLLAALEPIRRVLGGGEDCREELSQKFKKGGPFPCLIAHSFGTYLSGRAMRDLSWASYDRMVLAGCVLADDFPWEGLRESKPQRFHEVRNEMAARDNVARLPGVARSTDSGIWLGWLFWVSGKRRVGTRYPAGQTPFATLADSSKTRAPIHNIRCEELGHSDVFLGPAYAVIYWLPFFVGI